jgi:hypothetical protein
MSKKAVFAVVFLLAALGANAGGVSDPSVTVATAAEDVSSIRINWTGAENTQAYRYGLYRANKADRTYSLVQEVSPSTVQVRDEGLEPPLSNYGYFISHVDRSGSLQPTRERPVDDEAFRRMATVSGEAPPTRRVERPAVRLNNEGVYFGLVLFDNKVRSEPRLIPLDPTGRQELLERLNVSYIPSTANGTALYYAEHTALAYLDNLEKSGALPSNLESVNIITFTDGLDTSSTDMSFPPLDGNNFAGGQTNAYRTFISQQMKSKKTGGKKIDAWAIGIQGRDIVSNADFAQTLDAVASSQDNIVFLNNVSQIESQLTDLSEKLHIFTPRNRLTWTAPAYSVGTTVRLTFDNAASADNSRRYIEGRVVYANGVYSISNVRAEGVTLANNEPITGRRADAGIEYAITLDSEVDGATTMQWYKLNSLAGDPWLMNSEFKISRLIDFTSSRKSAIVYLVLDCSSSLSQAEIDRIRNAIILFIDKLYNSADASNSAAALARTGITAGGDVPAQPAAPFRQFQQQPPQGEAQYAPQAQGQTTHIYIMPPSSDQALPKGFAQAPPQAQSPYVLPQQPFAVHPSASTKNSDWSEKYSGFWIQVGAYRELRFAEDLWVKLYLNGCANAEIFSKELEGEVYYRVKVGPYRLREEAEAMLAVIRAANMGLGGSYIVKQ